MSPRVAAVRIRKAHICLLWTREELCGRLMRGVAELPPQPQPALLEQLRDARQTALSFVLEPADQFFDLEDRLRECLAEVDDVGHVGMPSAEEGEEVPELRDRVQEEQVEQLDAQQCGRLPRSRRSVRERRRDLLRVAGRHCCGEA